ncbi:MAG: serine hydrolase domain-containing protein, partial [Anaerolineales bacterium]
TDYGTLDYESISLPLRLTDTRETLTDEQTGRLAQGYTSSGSPAGYFPSSGAMSGAGYLRSTLNDMTRFLIANMNLNSATLGKSIALAQTVQAKGSDAATRIGLGWEIDHPGNSDERLSKGGETAGFTSYISFLRDGSSGFVLLTNGMGVGRIVPDVINIMQER